MDLLTFSVSFEDILEDVREGLSDKNPHMRFQLLDWIDKALGRAIEEKKGGNKLADKYKEGLKSYESMMVKMNSDGTSEVRESARKVLVSLAELLDKDMPHESRSESKAVSKQNTISKDRRKSVEKVKEK